MRVLLLAAVLLGACGDLKTDSRALAPAPAAPSATPLPSGVIDPRPLIERDGKLTATVQRVDKTSATLTTMAEFSGPGTTGPSITTAPIWAVAIIGVIRADTVIDVPLGRCAVFAHDARTGDVLGMKSGALSLCQPYFTDSLMPPDEPVRCPSEVYANGVSRTFVFSDTRAGTVRLETRRDDAWRQPTTVPGTVLMKWPVDGVSYMDAYCVKAFIRQGPKVMTDLAQAIGAKLPDPYPAQEFAIWLRGYHATSGRADANGHITITVQPQPGFEWAFFDWHDLVPRGGYVMFAFVDTSSSEILPWRLANGP